MAGKPSIHIRNPTILHGSSVEASLFPNGIVLILFFSTLLSFNSGAAPELPFGAIRYSN